MTTLWLVFFIVGSLCGRAAGGYSWRQAGLFAVGLLVGAAAVLLRRLVSNWGRELRALGWQGTPLPRLPQVARRRLVAVSFGACGWFWGATHAAPPLAHKLAAALVVRGGASYLGGYGAAPLLVQDGDDLYESFGAGAPGTVGNATAAARGRLFARHQSHFQARYTPDAAEFGFWESAVGTVRHGLEHRLSAQPAFLRRWLAGLLLGDKTRLPRRSTAAFRRTGLMHLLAVSGLHVSLLAGLGALLLQAPFRLAYALRLISPILWRYCASVLHLGAAVLALLYLALTGAPTAAQRSSLLFIHWQLSYVFIGVMPLLPRLLLIAGVQAALYPIGFVSEATLMSWTAYLLIVDRRLGSWRQLRTWRDAVLLQIKLTALATAAFGQLTWLGLGLNLILVPIFMLVMLSTSALMLWPQVPGRRLLWAFIQDFVGSIDMFSALTERFSWLAPAAASLPPWVRPVAAFLVTISLLNTCRRLSIRA